MDVGKTNAWKYLGVLVTFLVFTGILFYVFQPSMPEGFAGGEMLDVQQDGIEEAAPAMAMIRADDAAVQEEENVSSLTPIIWIMLLSLAGTMLSWTAVEQVVKRRSNVMLVTLDDEGSEKIMQALTNKTCKQILDILKDNELTESQIAKNLNMSLPRVHYNLKALTDAGLVEAESFRYSEKGREMDIYTLTNKYIVIAPHEKKEESVK